MKTIVKSSPEKESRIFEAQVLKLLHIEQWHFNYSIDQYKGYAILLRNWIKDCRKQGQTTFDIANTIRKSSLALESISQGEALCFHPIAVIETSTLPQIHVNALSK
ncbi:hypothetical protein [Aquimarina muelleri]|uniref:Uncharacterized protein n=1 Tax=Aquimarina muelleri TaxID=279356 RepID=A0A918JVL9_9FLAO|nr:hypothetical protein [Aquimarina muelleri]MCX2765053.1 hypothetical protein [Aquimarina muelleri]GGX19140.1 hypothetical protein GCM10007384_20600 [Aquimarina muelleri]